MGNAASSGRSHHEDTVDFGYLTPQGIYTGPKDWNQSIVTQLICERKLAPFYRPLDEYDESWDDEQILAARKEPPEADGAAERAESINSATSKSGHHKRPSAVKESVRHPEAAVYRGAVECPICFLYYPPNINHSRCCDQAICTECFVQIKRADPTTTHLVSEPAACPYCVQENFGVVYTPPPWRTGVGSEGATPPSWPDSPKGVSQQSLDASAAHSAMKRRRKSFGHDSPEVVTIDQIRPDWEAKLAAVRAAVARRANRRIIMRQVGDRLIPVGVTSGRVHALPTAEDGVADAEGGGDRGSRRSRRRQQNQELNQYLGSMGLGGQDLEELMVMEAMRLSLIEHEEQQRRQREEEAKKQAAEGSAQGAQTQGESAGSSSATPTAPPAVVEDTSAPTSATATPPESSPISSPRSTDAESSLLSPLTPVSVGESLQMPPSASQSRTSLDTSTSQNQFSGRRSGRTSPAPYSAISAAAVSAASTASAVASPSFERPSIEPNAPEESATLVNDDHSQPRIPQPHTDADGTDDAATADTLPGSRPISVAQRNTSFTSSIVPSQYDVLPSSPDSNVSRKPLLGSSAELAPVRTISDGTDNPSVN
ncbi:Protein SIP5 [Grifola frondosa]|uniref:Protein SIP5 n=1 Tax=Grifola frondosa TaxID=5627 RepID=A0A1C7MEA8_GRIFR|nr:Protein SIP5 [Grifola frondosa]